MLRFRYLGLFTILSGALLLACGGDDASGDGDGDGDIGSYSVSGTVVDFETGDAIDGSATISTNGLSPAPTVSVTGADFRIDGVPPHSVFNILAGAPPTYRSSYSVAAEVEEADIDGVEAQVVSESYLSDLADAFGVTPGAGTGVLIAQVRDDQGAPVAGIPAAAFEVNNAAPKDGPYFLDEALAPAPQLTSTSASGYVVFYDVEEGLVAVTASEGSGYTLVMSSTPVASTAVSLSIIQATEGETTIPTGVSFANDVVPIFDARGCSICHSGNGIGRDLGNLTLDGSSNLIYKELTEEISPNFQTTRVDTENPAMSLLLTMPSAEDPPDEHPNITFTSAQDPDYLTILGWITDGAMDN